MVMRCCKHGWIGLSLYVSALMTVASAWEHGWDTVTDFWWGDFGEFESTDCQHVTFNNIICWRWHQGKCDLLLLVIHFLDYLSVVIGPCGKP